MIKGNSREKLDGLDVYLSISEDPFTTPDDDDGLTPKQHKSWSNDDWYYVSATVTLSLNGVEIGSASYGGLEFGTFLLTNDNDEITGTTELGEDHIWKYVGDELAGEALSNAYVFSDAMQAWRIANPSGLDLQQCALSCQCERIDEYIEECVRNHEWIGTPQYCNACGVDKGNEREN